MPLSPGTGPGAGPRTGKSSKGDHHRPTPGANPLKRSGKKRGEAGKKKKKRRQGPKKSVRPYPHKSLLEGKVTFTGV